MADPQTISPARRWAITLSVMMVTVMQVLDTSVTNVALPHMQGSMSAGIEEMSWVVTSYLAANAVAIPATGWLSAHFGRRRFFLICTVLFTVSSFLSGIAPNLEFLVAMRVLQGLGGGPVIPMAQAIMWEIFPLRQRGTAMAVWGVGIMLAPILGPTVGGWVCDNWSWRWIFYINLPIGALGFLLVSAFLFDSPWVSKPRRIDVAGLFLMMFGFGFLQLALHLGEKKEWVDSRLIIARLMLMGGCLLNAFAAALMTHLTLGMDYWSLAWPRFLQGFAMGFIFPPLQTLTLATIRLERLGNATAAYNVVRNVGGSVGVAMATTLLVRRSQEHQSTLVAHVDVWSPDTARRLKELTAHFVSQGADSFTAGRQALALLYRRTTEQAQVLAYADDFWLISIVFLAVLPLIPLMRRVHAEQNERARESSGRVEALPVPEE